MLDEGSRMIWRVAFKEAALIINSQEEGYVSKSIVMDGTGVVSSIVLSEKGRALDKRAFYKKTIVDEGRWGPHQTDSSIGPQLLFIFNKSVRHRTNSSNNNNNNLLQGKAPHVMVSTCYGFQAKKAVLNAVYDQRSDIVTFARCHSKKSKNAALSKSGFFHPGNSQDGHIYFFLRTTWMWDDHLWRFTLATRKQLNAFETISMCHTTRHKRYL
eukprot:4467082-Amphidinium_carterae.2